MPPPLTGGGLILGVMEQLCNRLPPALRTEVPFVLEQTRDRRSFSAQGAQSLCGSWQPLLCSQSEAEERPKRPLFLNIETGSDERNQPTTFQEGVSGGGGEKVTRPQSGSKGVPPKGWITRSGVQNYGPPKLTCDGPISTRSPANVDASSGITGNPPQIRPGKF